MLSLRAGLLREKATWKKATWCREESGVNAIQSECHPWTSNYSRGPTIGALVESRSVVEKSYLMLDKVQSECRPKIERELPSAEKSPE
ncbi:hypothetical protein PTKIN_Ptkin01aG0094100 [Pterospermum kingtungense]